MLSLSKFRFSSCIKTLALHSFCSKTPFGLSSDRCALLDRKDMINFGVLTEEDLTVTDPYQIYYTAVDSIQQLFPEYSSIANKSDNPSIIELFSNENSKSIMDLLRTSKSDKQCMQPLNELFSMVIRHLIAKKDLDPSMKVPVNILSMHRFRSDICTAMQQPKLVVDTPDWTILHSYSYGGAIFKAKYEIEFGKVELKEKERVYAQILSSSLMAMWDLRNSKVICKDASAGFNFSMDSLLVIRDRFIPIRVSVTDEYLTAFGNGEELIGKANQIKMEGHTFNGDPFIGFLFGPHSIFESVIVYNMIRYCLMRACVNGFGYQKIAKQYNINL